MSGDALLLVFNVGSSGAKHARFSIAGTGSEPVLLAKGHVDREAGLGGPEEVGEADRALIAAVLDEAER